MKYQVYYGSQALGIFTEETSQNGLLGELEDTLQAELPNGFPYGIYDVMYTGYELRDNIEVLTYLVTLESEEGEDFDIIQLVPVGE